MCARWKIRRKRCVEGRKRVWEVVEGCDKEAESMCEGTKSGGKKLKEGTEPSAASLRD